MSYTLFDATLDLARTLAEVYESTCTSAGTTTTVVDSTLTSLFPTDWFNGGTLWMPARTVSGTAYAAESEIISDFGTATITCGTLAVASASGNSYMAAGPQFPKKRLVQAINKALLSLGKIAMSTTFTATADEQEYTTSDNAAVGYDIVKVEIANASAEPYNWTLHQNWRQIPGSSATADLSLVFDEGYEPSSAYLIRVTYLDYHAELTTDASVISQRIPRDWLRWAAAAEAWRSRMQTTRQDEPQSKEQLEHALAQASMQSTKLSTLFADTQRTAKASRW